jgi:hypothetical protein
MTLEEVQTIILSTALVERETLKANVVLLSVMCDDSAMSTEY